MGLGNGQNSRQGDKGSNHSYEHRVLLALGQLVTAAGAPPGAATEATLANIETLTTTIDAILDAIKLDTDNLNLGTTGTVTSVASSVTNVTLLEANTARKSVKITNDGSDVLYIKEGATASLTSFTWKVFADETVIIDDYNGVITGIWDVASGSARVTETT